MYLKSKFLLNNPSYSVLEAVLQVWGCWGCLEPLAEEEAVGDHLPAHRRCVVIEELLHQAKGLQEEVSRLHSIRDEKLTISPPRLQLLMSKQTTFLRKGQAEPVPARVGSRHSQDGKGWKLVCDFWHREECFCSTSGSAITEQNQCPHSQRGAEVSVQDSSQAR